MKQPVVVNDNGAWCWFQDPRALIDPVSGTILVGSIAASDGPGGDRRAGDVDLTAYHLCDQTSQRFVLHPRFRPSDDHNTPALLIRPDGRYLAVYTDHNLDNFTYWRISTHPHDATQWGPQRRFDWTPHLNPGEHVTYSNLFYLSGEKRMYNFCRAVNQDPSILISKDQGESWSFAGKLLTLGRLGYVNGYTKYASNGVDRIDFITTEHHPRDFDNSVYHGHLQNGKLHRSDGSVVEEDVFHSVGSPQTALTQIFAAGSVHGGAVLSRGWTVDLRLDQADRPCAIISARANDPDGCNFDDHRFLYARFDGKQWNVHPLAKAGACLWREEEDYTGLAALNPRDPNRVCISTPIDPGSGVATPCHELHQGVTRDGGASWTWSAITRNSTVNNLRPIMPDGDDRHSALLWFRGKMPRSQKYDCAVVGLIDPP